MFFPLLTDFRLIIYSSLVIYPLMMDGRIFFNNVVVMAHVFVGPPELYLLSPLSLTSVHCHKSTGWEAVQLAPPSSLDGMGYWVVS